MTDNAAIYRELDSINQNIGKLFKYHDETMNIMTQILTQTTKTNGRVNSLEEKHTSCPINKVSEETEVVRFYSRKPKLLQLTILGFIVGCIVSVAVSLTSSLNAVEAVRSFEKAQTEEYIKRVLESQQTKTESNDNR